MGLAVHNDKTSNSEVPIDKININILEIFQNLKNVARFNFIFFTRYKCIVTQKDSWININQWFGYDFLKWDIRKVWRARNDGHHYDVTSKCGGVTRTKRLVEWTMSTSEINGLFCCFQDLSGFKKIQTVTQIHYGIKATRHHNVFSLYNPLVLFLSKLNSIEFHYCMKCQRF